MRYNTANIPNLLSFPLRLIPNEVHSQLLVRAFNTILKQPLHHNELNDLRGHHINIQVTDLRVSFHFTVVGGKFKVCSPYQHADVVIAGATRDIFSLITRQEDSDTLFFQRRLKLSGNTELGLRFKNVFDAIDIDALYIPALVKKILKAG